jgi:hypothetical protein
MRQQSAGAEWSIATVARADSSSTRHTISAAKNGKAQEQTAPHQEHSTLGVPVQAQLSTKLWTIPAVSIIRGAYRQTLLQQEASRQQVSRQLGVKLPHLLPPKRR